MARRRRPRRRRLGQLVAPPAPGPLTLLVNSASLFEDDRIAEPDAAELGRGDRRQPARAGAARPGLRRRHAAGRRGLIVNIVDQRVLRPTPQFFSYAVSKAALWSATQMMAQALAPAHPGQRHRARAHPALDPPVAGGLRRRDRRSDPWPRRDAGRDRPGAGL